MKQFTFSSKSIHFFLLVVICNCGFWACNQTEQKSTSVITSTDSAAAKVNSYNSSRTPYICAARSLQAMEKGDLNALFHYVHPVKGLTITHVSEYIENHEKPFSIKELKNEIQQPTLYTIVNTYEEEVDRTSTLADLLTYYAMSNTTDSKIAGSRFFSTAKDIRRNYVGNGTYQLTPPLAAGQTTISYHFIDSLQEMNWQEMVLRTETYQHKDYLVEVVRAFWTP